MTLILVMTQEGQDLSKLTFIICGIVRNAERGLRHNIPVISCFCQKTGGYEIVLFENDSRDRTKELLYHWASTDCHVHVNCEDHKCFPMIDKIEDCHKNENPFYSKRRIGRMVALRNQYMDYIEEHGMRADYLIVVDMDVEQIYLDGILSCFKHDNNWDAVTAFGYSFGPKLRKRYHDTFALEEYGTLQRPKTEKNIRRLQDKYRNLNEHNWVRVDSAFGGLAIYNFKAVKGLRYMLLDNADRRVRCRCEHSSLALQMKKRGYDRFFINPQMRICYQRLTLRIVWNSVKRKLHNIL